MSMCVSAVVVDEGGSVGGTGAVAVGTFGGFVRVVVSMCVSAVVVDEGGSVEGKGTVAVGFVFFSGGFSAPSSCERLRPWIFVSVLISILMSCGITSALSIDSVDF